MLYFWNPKAPTLLEALQDTAAQTENIEQTRPSRRTVTQQFEALRLKFKTQTHQQEVNERLMTLRF